jgi:hypothetical protein
MPRKIFISYRRQDSAANALGIGQYLEHAFGRKNVFIDVDMRAGTKFPAVLEERLAECKVMLVLIGSDWLNAQDEQGQRRLDSPDDWVRLEIAHALKRDITVIPVRVNGAQLPARATLPADIRGLLDHQAVSVTTTGFRNEMAGLVRDIRSIPSPKPWRRFGAIAAGVSLLLAALAAWEGARLYHTSNGTPSTSEANRRDAFAGSPGEWVMYGIANRQLAHYFKLRSVHKFEDKVAYEARFVFDSFDTHPSENGTSKTGAFEDDTNVLDCKRSIWAGAERTVYNRSGEVLTHFKWGDPESLDLSSLGTTINPGSILASGAHILCDGLESPLLSKEQIAKMDFTYLSNTSDGKGDIFYGPTKLTSKSDYQLELMTIIKFHQDHGFADLSPGNTVLGGPSTYRTLATLSELDCADKTIRALKLEYYDSDGDLNYLFAPQPVEPNNIPDNSPFALLHRVVCGASVPTVVQVHGTYEGRNTTTYEKGGEGEQRISIIVNQTGEDVNVNFEGASGSTGKGTGKLAGGAIESMSLQNTTPGCPGAYDASLKFEKDAVTWSYKGQDCGGPMNGHGDAKRVKP